MAAWIEVIPPEKAEGDLARDYDRMAGPDGKVDHILQVHGLNPPSLGAHWDLYKVALHGPSELSRADRELIGVVVSRENGCHY